jgi:predicted ATPase
MKISTIKLENIRGYKYSKIKLSPKINLLVGENNSGKTTILKSLLLLQDVSVLGTSDIRNYSEKGTVTLQLQKDNNGKFLVPEFNNSNLAYVDTFKYDFFLQQSLMTLGNRGSIIENTPIRPCILAEEPNNFIYPFLSKRKVPIFLENIGESFANSVSGNFAHLSAKVDRISTDGLPAKDEYTSACREILGFHISSFPSVNGKKPVYIIGNSENIPLESMGEGVSNILGLILDLCFAEDKKLFLIEEPENDIHPKALKRLLNLIVEKSIIHQFVITTHSNIVLKHLGSNDSSKIFKVEMTFDEDKIPTSSISEIENTPEARREVLEDLGYELFDFDIWDTWLILEESSAEVIIREFLIPHFVPSLKDVLKTCAAGSVSKVSARIEALHSLCLFLHLQKSFNDRIWVIVDGGETEKKITDDLKNKYKSWKEDRIIQFAEHDFENYYPQQFQAQVSDILTKSADDKRKAKKELLDEVKKWYKENPDLAKEEFEKSAIEVINILKGIEAARCNLE